MFTEELKTIGLSQQEALVYDILLRTSPAGASLLAKKANLSRSSVYTLLSTLAAKGLVGTTYRNEVKQFTAEGYPALAQLVERQKASITQQEKALQSMGKGLALITNQSRNIPDIVFFEGQDGLKRIYLSMLRQASKNDVMHIIRDEFIWGDSWQFTQEKDWRQKVGSLKQQKNICTKLLLNNSKVEQSKKAYYKSRQDVTFQFLPKGKEVKDFSLYILGDMVSILSIEKNHLVGVQIINQNLAANFKKIFESLW